MYIHGHLGHWSCSVVSPSGNRSGPGACTKRNCFTLMKLLELCDKTVLYWCAQWSPPGISSFLHTRLAKEWTWFGVVSDALTPKHVVDANLPAGWLGVELFTVTSAFYVQVCVLLTFNLLEMQNLCPEDSFLLTSENGLYIKKVSTNKTAFPVALKCAEKAT